MSDSAPLQPFSPRNAEIQKNALQKVPSRSERRRNPFAVLEAFLTAILGALVSRTFTWLLLSAYDDNTNAVFWIGFLFHGWPGFIDVACLLAVGESAFNPNGLLPYATIVGGLIGFWDGWHQIHDWRRFGAFTFLLDVTWGGAAVGIGALIHFLNLGWGSAIASQRIGAHRYDAGISAKRQYAITIGNVCGNLRGQGEGGIFRHECLHVLQNRLFGPIYLYSYVGWIATLLLPALIYGSFVRRLYATCFSWCYLNNPWEEWAYRSGGSRDPALVWPTRRIVSMVIVFVSAILVIVWTVAMQSTNG